MSMYAYAFPAIMVSKKWHKQGTLCDIPGHSSQASSDLWWPLFSACTTMAQELAYIMPPIEDIHFTFKDLTHIEWLKAAFRFGEATISRMRKLTLSGWTRCQSGTFQDFHFLREHLDDHRFCAQRVDPSRWQATASSAASSTLLPSKT